MFQRFSQYQKNRLIMAGVFLLFAIIISVFQFFQGNIGQISKHEHIAELNNAYVSTLQGEVREKVLRILDDAEVQKTLERIQNSDEFYKKDGAVFMNREKRLPVKQDREYYAEWTIKTPGEKTRGTKRIVVGKGGEMYFTDNHYETFLRVQ